MGSGKGDPDYWVAVIKPGKILYEMKGISEPVARAAMRIASYKMPVKTQFLVRPTATQSAKELKRIHFMNVKNNSLSQNTYDSTSNLFDGC
jgi:hypothetical protein